MFNKRPEDHRPIEAYLELSPINDEDKRLVRFHYDNRDPHEETVVTRRMIQTSTYDVTDDNVSEKTWVGGLIETHFTPPLKGLPHSIHNLDQQALRACPERFYPYLGQTITSVLARYALHQESANFYTVFSRDIKKVLPRLGKNATYTFLHEQDMS